MIGFDAQTGSLVEDDLFRIVVRVVAGRRGKGDLLFVTGKESGESHHGVPIGTDQLEQPRRQRLVGKEPSFQEPFRGEEKPARKVLARATGCG